jgi:hypothetical protein
VAVKLTYRYITFFKFTLWCKQSNIVPLFATCVVNTGGKFTVGVMSNFYQLTHTLSFNDIATSLGIIVVSYFLYAHNPLQSVLEFLNSSMGATNRVGIGCRTGPPGYIGWRSRFLGIDSL